MHQIGLIGLATMGANLARNIADKGFSICVFNRTTEVTEEFIKNFGNKNLTGAKNLKEFIQKLERPRKIILLVKAGVAVDAVIEQLKPFLDKEDLIIDCGNSNYKETIRRSHELNFLGCGISGGEEGALNGPSIMPGGNKHAYKLVEKIFSKIAAKDFQGKPCVTYIGDGGAGHFVKTVHNGIEYAMMQMIAEIYDIYRKTYKLTAPQIAEIFNKYNKGKLKSYLIEITGKILEEKDKKGYLIDFILDKAGQKGTGSWTAIEALEEGISLPTITEAVFARINSSEKDLRKKLSQIYKSKITKKIPLDQFIKIAEESLYAGLLIAYAQGYNLISKTAKEQNWKIDLGEISRIWQGGCIIRADILKTLHQAYSKNKNPQHLFLIYDLTKPLQNLRKLISIITKVPIPALSSALQYFNYLTGENSSANLIQAQRDFFGAHTFERTDKKGTFHQGWGE